MKTFRAGFFALVSFALLGTAWARPALIAPIRLAVPPTAGEETWYLQPVIDGDTLMVEVMQRGSAAQTTSIRIFERASNGSWNYAGVLTNGSGALFLQGALAVVSTQDNIRVFERGAQGWTQTATLSSGVPKGSDLPFRVDNGAIFMRRHHDSSDTACVRDWVLRKVNTQWQQTATVGPPNCGDQGSQTADVNEGRALVVNQPPDIVTPQPPADVLVDTGAASWSRVATLPAPRPQSPVTYVPWFGPAGSISSSWAYVEPRVLYRNSGANNWAAHGRLAEPEADLNPSSYGGVLRGNTLVLQGQECDYELPNFDDDNLTQWRALRVYRPRDNGSFDYYAKLAADFDVGAWSVSGDGRRVAAISLSSNHFGEPIHLFVFEIPDSVSFAGTQQDTFETGNFARWTPTGGEFGVATNGATRVLRQTSLAGDAGAYLTALDWGDQSIEADIRPLAYAGKDRWFGLVARRVDARNYYYVTFRATDPGYGMISLRRLRDGVVTDLDQPRYALPFVPGHNYRVRLEAVGDQLAVFVDGIPVLHVKDSSFTHGHPGIAGYRASFETDNVIVSPATRFLVRFDSSDRDWASPPAGLTGQWGISYDAGSDIGFRRQGDTSGDARWFSTTGIGNQVVSARVRPMSYGAATGTQDPWVGIAAHVIDEQNYWYLTLRRSNQVSLRRVVNGTVQVIATVPQVVTAGAWHDLRLEIIGTNIRAYVNGDLKIQASDSTMTGGGRSALLMYKTAADFATYIAYQP
jgi:hypothetical protein